MSVHVFTRPRTAQPLPATGTPAPGSPEDPGQLPGEGRAAAPWMVVAVWGVLLGTLAGVSAAMGNSMVVLEISGGAAVLMLAVAGALWLDERLRPSRGVFILPVRLGGTFLFALTAAMAWLSLAFGQYVLYLTVVPLTGAVLLEVAARRRPQWHR